MTPATPARLTVTARSNSSLDVAWSGTGTDTTQYLVERSLDGSTFSVLVTVANTQTLHLDTGLSTGTRYYYRVRGYNGTLYGSYSYIASAITANDPVADLAAHLAADDPHPQYLLLSDALAMFVRHQHTHLATLGLAASVVPLAQVTLSVPLATLTGAGSVAALTVVPGAVTVALNTLTLAGDAVDLTVQPGGVNVALTDVTLAGSVEALTVV